MFTSGYVFSVFIILNVSMETRLEPANNNIKLNKYEKKAN